LGELDEAGATEKEGGLDWMESMTKSLDEDRRVKAYCIQRAEDAREKINYRRRSSESGVVRIWGGRSADAHAALEQDFTTPGTPGRLGCPFASSLRPKSSNSNKGISTPRSTTSRVSLSRRSKRASFHDPIKADICGEMPPEASIEGSVPLCPIRFLDQHSPEEVAKYFENHKHELPRSHEMCVKRFQENEDALRSLDSRYANMVSMVKDLGKVHQPMLPDTEDIAVDDGDELVHSSAAKVENWAKAISNEDEEEDGRDALHDDDEEEEYREQRFDRSLKDIRVGESPSRPWGISVPENFKTNGDAASKKSDPTASPLEDDTRPNTTAERPTVSGCPFSGLHANPQLKPPGIHGGEEASKPVPQSTTKAQSSQDIPGPFKQFPQQTPSQMVFHGPVFIGYPIEQAMEFMKQFGGSGQPGPVM
jgi:hypothetical protein